MKQAQYGRLPQYFKDHKSGANCNLGLILTWEFARLHKIWPYKILSLKFHTHQLLNVPQ
jgi:hypothetical protein